MPVIVLNLIPMHLGFVNNNIKLMNNLDVSFKIKRRNRSLIA
jgi:hypothetical protein